MSTAEGSLPKSSHGGHFSSLNSGLNILITSLIGLAVTALFFVTVILTISKVDVAPRAPEVEAGTEGFDAFSRSVQVVGLVTPVLTTIVGFYFGVRAGSSGKEAAESRADRAEETAQAVTSDATVKMVDTQRALTELKERLATNAEASSIVERVEAENPNAFRVDDWLKRVDRLPQK